MNAQIDLIEGTTRDLSKSQWFTPPELAQKVVEWAGIKSMPSPPPLRSMRSMSVLEPSAGNGALVRPLVAAGAHVCAIEIDARYHDDLKDLRPWATLNDNFLELAVDDLLEYDLCVMNPPYENGLDVAFILHALKFAPRVVGIFRSALLHGAQRKRELWAQVRPTRIAFLSERPHFDESGGSARSDFIVAELARSTPEGYGRVTPSAEDVNCEWW